jgi:hypothetical protein
MKRLILAVAVVLSTLFAVSAPALAATDVFENTCHNQSAANSAVCDNVSNKDPVTGTNGILYKTTRIVSVIAGIAAVIMMMAGGFMYVTSAGDSGKATTARNTMIYAAVGLIVIGLGQALITLFVNTTK